MKQNETPSTIGPVSPTLNLWPPGSHKQYLVKFSSEYGTSPLMYMMWLTRTKLLSANWKPYPTLHQKLWNLISFLKTWCLQPRLPSNFSSIITTPASGLKVRQKMLSVVQNGRGVKKRNYTPSVVLEHLLVMMAPWGVIFKGLQHNGESNDVLSDTCLWDKAMSRQMSCTLIKFSINLKYILQVWECY